ncbi:PAS domain S-box protein [Elusimicrobiota bacterium]
MKYRQKTKRELIKELEALKEELSRYKNQQNKRNKSQEIFSQDGKKFREMAELLPEIIYEIDGHGTVSFINKQAFKITGYTHMELEKGFKALNLIAPQDRPKARENIQKVMLGKKISDYEYTLMRKDGSTFPAIMKASVIIKDGEPAGLRGIIINITERKKTENRIQSLNEMQKSIIDSASVWLDMLDEDSNVVIWNKAAEEISGYSREEVIGHKKIWQWLYPDNKYRKEIMEQLAAIIKRNIKVEQFVSTIRRKDGESRIISWSIRKIKDKKSRTIGSFALGRDVTERKKAEEEAKKYIRSISYLSKTAMGFVELLPEEDIYQKICTYLKEISKNDTVIICSYKEGSGNMNIRAMAGDGKISKKVKEILKRDLMNLSLPISKKAKTELLKGKLVDIAGGMDMLSGSGIPKAVYRPLNRLLKIGNICVAGFAREGRLFGGAVIIAADSFKNRNKKIIETFASQASVALQHRLSEENLRRSEEKFRDLADMLPESVIEMDANNKFTYINNIFQEIFGYTEKDIEKGLDISEIVMPKDRDRLTDALQRVVSGDDLPGMEYTGKKKDGSEIPIVVHTNRIIDRTVVGLRAIIIDITERKRMEHQMIQQSKLASIGQLAAGVAHELNNPLTIIVTMPDLLDMALKGKMTAQDQHDLMEIKNLGLRMKKIISDLLTFSRMSKPGERNVGNINNIIRMVLQLMKSELNRKGVSVTKHFAKVPSFLCDNDKLMEVFVNLFSNSIDALSGRKNKSISVNTKYNKQEGIIQVNYRDNGHGIKEGIIEEIFDPFFTTKEVGKGTGMGLSIVYGIVNDHDGYIEVRSRENKYTEFILNFPAKKQEKLHEEYFSN